MATPVSKEADEARWFFARKRRRTLQNLSDYKIAGFVPPSGTPFDFGSFGIGASPNSLIIPADIEIAMISSGAVLSPQQIGINAVSDGLLIFNNAPANPGELIRLNHVFRKNQVINVARFGASPGSVQIFFAGPKTQLSQFGEATFT